MVGSWAVGCVYASRAWAGVFLCSRNLTVSQKMHQRSVDAQISHSPNPAIGRCPLPPGEYGLCPRAGDARNIEEKVELRAAARTELLDLEAVMPPEALQALQGVRFMSGRRAAAAATGASGEHYGRLTTAFLDLRLEDCILLFLRRLVSSKNAIVRSPPKRGRIESCQLSLFPESLRHRAPLLVCSQLHWDVAGDTALQT